MLAGDGYEEPRSSANIFDIINSKSQAWRLSQDLERISKEQTYFLGALKM